MKVISLLIYLGGGGIQLNPPGHIETNKLRGSIKELGGSTSLTLPAIRTLQYSRLTMYLIFKHKHLRNN